MGGLGSGSRRRSWIATTDEAIRLPMSWVQALPEVEILREALAADVAAQVELEVFYTGPEGYVFRPWVGTRTKHGFPGELGQVPRTEWLSETSLFVRLIGTRPNYGGVRLWFVCPQSACGRRCSILYREANTNARAFRCRRCARLAYRSQRMCRRDRMEYRAAKLVARLDPTWNWGAPIAKPKRMHWGTFNRIAAEVDRLDRRWQPAMASKFALSRSEEAVQEKLTEVDLSRVWEAEAD